MKKFILSIIIATVLTACGEKAETPKENTKPVVKIGVSLPLTGNLADTGASAKASVEMAFEKWKQKNTKYDYQLFIEDDAGKAQNAVLNAQNFINVKEVSAILTMYGIVDRPVDEIANQNKIISMSCSYGKLDVPEYGVNNCTQNKEVEEVLIPKLKEENIKRVALIMNNTAVSTAVGDYFAELLPKEGFEIVAYEKYNMDTRDMRTSILAIEEKKPDYYITFAITPTLDIFIKQLKELTGKRNITSLGSFYEMQPKNYYLIEDLWTVHTTIAEDDFVKELTDKTKMPLRGCSANLYDNLDILILAFENTPAKEGHKLPENKEVITKIRNIKDWKGAVGKLSFENGISRTHAEIRSYQKNSFKRM